MELVGEENRMRTLFSELRVADEQAAPSFAATWNRAQIQSVKRRGFNLAFVAATALLICAVLSLAWWSTHSQPGQSPNSIAVVNSAPGAPPVVAPSATGPEPIKPATTRDLNSKSRALRFTTRRQATLIAANRKTQREALAIANWQSPTSTLLTSPADGLFNSLPQLDENSKGLKSFLSNK